MVPTSLSNLGECQTRTPLEINIVGVNKSAKCSERFAAEEVDFRPLFFPRPLALHEETQSERLCCKMIATTYVFQKLKQVRHCFPLAVL